MQGRKFAVQLLDQTEQAGSYSNLLLDHALHQVEMEQKEKNLCTVLFYGVLTRRITLDAILKKYSKKPVAKLDPTVRNILHVGLYQLLYLDHIPDRAAVDESVKLTKQCRKASASGFVNAVLRSFLRDEKQIPLPKQKKQAISIQYAAPLWLVDLLLKQYGETETIAFLENALQPAPLTIRRNPLLATEEQLLEALQEHQIRHFKRAGFMCRMLPRRFAVGQLEQSRKKPCWMSVLLRAEKPVPLQSICREQGRF